MTARGHTWSKTSCKPTLLVFLSRSSALGCDCVCVLSEHWSEVRENLRTPLCVRVCLCVWGGCLFARCVLTVIRARQVRVACLLNEQNNAMPLHSHWLLCKRPCWGYCLLEDCVPQYNITSWFYSFNKFILNSTNGYDKVGIVSHWWHIDKCTLCVYKNNQKMSNACSTTVSLELPGFNERGQSFSPGNQWTYCNDSTLWFMRNVWQALYKDFINLVSSH